jgi:beta-galactosidase
VVDADGVTVPNGSTAITFAVAGKGRLAGVDNGALTSHASYQDPRCLSAQGRCLAVVQALAAGGKIGVKATAPGLADGSLELGALPEDTQP